MKVSNKTYARIILVLLVILCISFGFFIGFWVTSTRLNQQPLEFEKTNAINEFLAVTYSANETDSSSNQEPECCFSRLSWYWNPTKNNLKFFLEGGELVNLTIFCFEGYFIKYPINETIEALPFGFNSSYLYLHTSLSFYNINSNVLNITNISFWKVI